MNCRIKTLFVILFFLVGCQGYDDREPIQRTAAQGVVAMDEDELTEYGPSEEEIFRQQMPAGGAVEGGSTSAWSASGILITGGEEAVQLQVDFPVSGPYTLQFSLEQVDAVVGGASATAEIDWKVEGNWVHRAVTVSNGTAVSGTAQACRVTIRDSSQSPAGQPFRASIQIGAGTRGANSQPPMYQPDFQGVVLPIMGAHTFPVPQNVGVISVWLPAQTSNRVVPTPGSVTAYLLTPMSTVGFLDLTSYEWQPIPPGTTSIAIANGSGVQIVVMAPLFGIEG